LNEGAFTIVENNILRDDVFFRFLKPKKKIETSLL